MKTLIPITYYGRYLYEKNTAWRLILSQARNIVADALSQLRNNGNKETTHKSTYTMEELSELYDIEELTADTFPLSFKLIYRYQWADPFITEKVTCATY